MKIKLLLLFTLIFAIPLTACSSASTNPPAADPKILEKDTIVTMEQDTEIQNLGRFHTFVSNQEKGIKDAIRIITLSPDGTTVPNDLTFDGKLFTLNITSKDPEDPSKKKGYTYTGTNLVTKQKGKYIEYDLKLKTEAENYIPLIFIPKENPPTKKS